MPDRRYTHQTRATIGADRDETYIPPCADNPGPYDVLIEYHQNIEGQGETYRKALTDAKETCGDCLTKTFVACMRRNADERWVQAMLRTSEKREPTARPKCGSHTGYEQHRRANEHPCDPCRKAEYARSNARKRDRRKKVAA